MKFGVDAPMEVREAPIVAKACQKNDGRATIFSGFYGKQPLDIVNWA